MAMSVPWRDTDATGGAARRADSYRIKLHSGERFLSRVSEQPVKRSRWDGLEGTCDGVFAPAVELKLDVPRVLLENAPGFDKSNWPDMTDAGYGRHIDAYWKVTVVDLRDDTANRV